MTGYWISSTRDRTVELTGEIPTDPVERTITVPDGGGWALVGISSMEEGLMASDLVAMYSGAISMVCSYNVLTHTYKTYYAMYPFTDFALTVGEGLWVFCGASGVLTYEP